MSFRLDWRTELIASVITFAAFTYLVFGIIVPSTGHMTHGFIGRYTASQLLLRGEFGPEAYDNEWFIQKVQAESGQPIGEIFKPNLPTLALLTIPFTLFPPQVARDAWIWINLAFLLVGLGCLADATARYWSDRPIMPWLVIATLAFLFRPVAANFFVGQVYILLFCLITLFLIGMVKNLDWLTGITLGLAFAFKTYGLPLWIILLIHRRWKSMAWGVGTILFLVLTSLPWIGIDTWLAYPRMVFSLGEDSVMATAFQSTPAFLDRFLRYDPVWNPEAVFDIPILADVLSLVFSLYAIAITISRGKNAPMLLFAAALIPLNAILLPVAEEPHFAMFLIPIFILMNELVQHPSARGFRLLDWALLIAGILLLGAPLPYKHSAISTGWAALLAYPRLYGGWIIWWLTMKIRP